MRNFILGVMVGICIGVAGTVMFIIYRARTYIKRMLEQGVKNKAKGGEDK